MKQLMNNLNQIVNKNLFIVGILVLLITVAHSQTNNITHYNFTNGCLPDSTIRSVFAPDSNELWVGTNKGLSHLVNGNWQLCSGLLSNGINDIISDKNGNIWIATNYSLVKFKNDQFTSYITSNSSIPCNYIKSLSCDESGNIWIATIGCGMLKYDGSNFTSYNKGNSQIISDSIYDLAIYNGKIYCIGFAGISIFNNSTWETIYPNDYASHNIPVQNIGIDNTGNLYLGGFYCGLVVYNGSDFSFYDETDPLLHKSIFGIYNYNGTILFGDFGYGLAKFEDNTIKYFDTLNKALPFEEGINRITSDNYGNLYVGTSHKGLYKIGSKLIGLGINENKEHAINNENAISIFPNPIERTLSIQFKEKASLNNINVFDIFGRNVLNFAYNGTTLKQLTLDLSIIESGLYIVKVNYPKGTSSSFKILKKQN
jgi:ligand-binding sensor domain-containing protein